jgi:thioredoxin-related protein
MRLNKLIIQVTVLLLVISGQAYTAEVPRDPYTYFFNESFGDYSEELENAKEQGKKAIMVFFEQDECPFCHRMKTTIMNLPSVQEYYRERFLLFAHDIEGDVEMVDFEGNETTQKEYAVKVQRVRATPVIAFFNLEGKRIARYIGATPSAKEFKWLADFVAEGHFKDTSFTRYKRERKKAERAG